MSAFRALICLLLSLFAPVVAFAAERLEAVYEITWGGIEIGRFETRLTANEVVYQLTYAAQTTGFLGWLFPFTSTGSSEGIVTEHGPAPERYVGQSQRGDGIGMWAVDFGPEGGVKRVVVTMPEDEERDPVPVALQKAPDPLALALRATQAAAPGTRFEDLSFDGKRAVRFELACAQQEHPVTPDHVEVPIEHGLHCTLDGELAAGASRRWQSTRDPDNQPVRILLSREVVPGRYWPVRAEAETRFGTVIARLIWFR